MTGDPRCDGCAFWRRHGDDDGSCRRRAPPSAESPDLVTHWPVTRAQQGCGEWAAPAPGAPALVACRQCRFWHTNPDGGLDPQNRGDARRDWWKAAGHCVRHAPAPSSYPGSRGFWRATHATDGCAEGNTTSG